MEISKEKIGPQIPTFWFMTDKYGFIRVQAETITEIARMLMKIAKENPCGMVCPVIVMRDGQEVRRIGSPAHVDVKGKVDLTQWLKELFQDELIRKCFILTNKQG